MDDQGAVEAIDVLMRLLNRLDAMQDKSTSQEEQKKLEKQYGDDAIHRTFGRLDAYCEIRQLIAHERDKLTG